MLFRTSLGVSTPLSYPVRRIDSTMRCATAASRELKKCHKIACAGGLASFSVLAAKFAASARPMSREWAADVSRYRAVCTDS
jgi:hypothetical protein